MKSKIQTAHLLRKIAFASTVIAAILQAVAMFTEFEPNTNYFYSGAILPTVACVFAVLGALLGTVAALILPTKFLRGSIFRNSRSVFPPSAIGFLLSGVLLLATARGTLGTAVALPVLIATVYAAMSGSPHMRADYKVTVVLLGFVAVAACITLNAYYYFDFSIEMNSPIKVAVQLAILLTMLALTGELRFILGIQKPRAQLILFAWVQSMGALSSVALPLAFLLGVDIRADYVAGAVLVLAVTVTQYLQTYQLINSSYRENKRAELESLSEDASSDPESPYAAPEDLQIKNSEDEQ